jgi:hypothetical protein
VLTATTPVEGRALMTHHTPKYKADVPEWVTTPDRVETKMLGTLDFNDGMPGEETQRKVYDFIDTARATEAFLNGIPAASIFGLLEGVKEAGVKPGELAITEDLLDARSLFLTANTSTIYCFAEINVKDGPLVMTLPPGVLGPLDDAYFRWVTDVGLTGPDMGRGGNYIFAHRDYENEIPEGYFVVNTPTYRNMTFFRVFVKDGDLKGAVDGVKAVFRLSPLDRIDDPPKQVFHNISGRKLNTIHANNFKFFEELNAVIQYEPGDAFDPELVGLFAAIGIKKGQPFNPDERMKGLLTEGVAIGNATARAITFAPRKKSAYLYEDRQWNSLFTGGSYEFLDNGERVLDDRIHFHYYVTGITPAVVIAKPGTGSSYAFTARDSEGCFLDGGKTYKVRLPNPVPVNRFWAFTVYSGQSRSMLETDQKPAGLDSLSPDVKADTGGDFTIWFGPVPPAGRESNWIQTMPGKSYNVMFRVYGPLEPWYDKTWKPGDLEQVE